MGMDGIDECAQVLGVMVRAHTVSHVANVLGGHLVPVRSLEGGPDDLPDFVGGGVEGGGVKIALNGLALGLHHLVALAEVQGGIQCNDVILGLGEHIQGVVRILGKPDHGHFREFVLDDVGDQVHVGEREVHPHLGRQTACIGIEHLQALGPSAHLSGQVVGAHVCQNQKHLVGGLGVGVDQLGSLGEGAGALALDHVHEERQGGTAEAEQGHSAIQLRAGLGDGCIHVVQRGAHQLGGVGDEQLCLLGGGHARLGCEAILSNDLVLQLLPSRFVRDRLIEHRPNLGHELDCHAHSLWDDKDIRKDDGPIQIVPVDGLQGDLSHLLGVLAHRKELFGLHKIPVLRKVAAGLAHDPHWNAINGLAPDGAQQPVVLQLRESVLGVASWG
mmetsp:Transcript_112924/g.196037  ORF Transcript_112924/g.196037 Transcript_112924/m.196037 type:complete len:387 (+) Transcript_112924:398-1558(+)